MKKAVLKLFVLLAVAERYRQSYDITVCTKVVLNINLIVVGHV